MIYSNVYNLLAFQSLVTKWSVYTELRKSIAHVKKLLDCIQTKGLTSQIIEDDYVHACLIIDASKNAGQKIVNRGL